MRGVRSASDERLRATVQHAKTALLIALGLGWLVQLVNALVELPDRTGRVLQVPLGVVVLVAAVVVVCTWLRLWSRGRQ